MAEHPRKPRAENELRGAAKHLMYEAEMFRTPLQYMAMAHRDVFLDNICLEAFARHARTLVAFLWAVDHTSEDDVLADDFFDDAAAWEKIRNQPLPFELQAVIQSNDSESHVLRYSRRSMAPRAKVWDLRAIYTSLNATLKLFAETAPTLDPIARQELAKAPNFPIPARNTAYVEAKPPLETATGTNEA